MGDAFCQPKMTPVFRSLFARRMSAALVTCTSVSSCSRSLPSQRAMLSIVCGKFSQIAIVAFMAVTCPALRLS